MNALFENQDKSDIGNLLFTVGLLHNIDHPPLGHGGECALNYKMHNHGGFEGNAPTLRLITKLSSLHLTYRILLGTLKYPVSYSKLVNTDAYPDGCYQKDCERVQDSKYLINRNNWHPPKCYYDNKDGICSIVLRAIIIFAWYKSY